MKKQMIISISREFGSGGHEIAENIARDLDLKFYDRGMLDEIAENMNVDVEVLQKYDEKPRNYMLSRRVGNHTNSMEEIIAEYQFDFIRKKAEEGESFVIVGRCAETVLKDFEELISIFITGERQHKIKRVMEHFNLPENKAIAKMLRHDRKRKQYHNRHSDAKWGDSRLYDLCINSSPLGIEGTIRVLENYIRERVE
ncbi:MAG: cytidylate kinase-like family protein [Lachnospiraceae bacterium]|nr:cytidylate kinase-like family protein [Agathobacter sp.]MDD6444621.1 cytidylate kinase-like family protein [Lachnospiraceae bacterium]MDY4892689.1 cytidylate kinase-like family protein [Agathobacter sp.]